MVDRQNEDEPIRGTEEYQLPEDDAAGSDFDVQTEQPAKKKIAVMDIVKNRRIMIPVGLVVVVFFAYQFFSSNTQTPQPQPQPTQTAKPAQTTSVQPQTSGAELGEVASVRAENVKLQGQVESLTAKVQRLNTQLGSATGDLLRMNQTLQNMEKRLEELARQKGLVHKKVRWHWPIYHLRAVVPGRAWLRDKKGDILTVRVGDKLGGYGAVVRIDSDHGWVATSSGKLIQYGKNDE